jgi:hypothetical protein
MKTKELSVKILKTKDLVSRYGNSKNHCQEWQEAKS